MPELIIEFYSEEIPAGLQEWAAGHIEMMIAKDFKEANLNYQKSESFWSPMRLSIILSGVHLKTLDISHEKRGPRLGSNRKAIEGFANNFGVSKNDLSIKNTSNGKFYFFTLNKKGLKSSVIIEKSIKNIIQNFPWRKSMRWGEGDIKWIRPLHSILCVFNGSPIKFKIENITTGNTTFGHRFMSKKLITICSRKDYLTKLSGSNVLLKADERESNILREGNSIAKKNKLLFKPDSNLVKEVANLVEYPYVFLGKFDDSYLKLPKEILELTMVKQQKYFPLYKLNGSLSSMFLAVANIKVNKESEVIEGNSRVIKARLSDAQYFYENDLRKGLTSYLDGLSNIIFHSDLGSMQQKVERLSFICKNFSSNFSANVNTVLKSAKLAKADLCTEVVYEMPELQGIIGSVYAELEKFPLDVVTSIKEHYSPVGPSDNCPSIPESALLSFADKMDSLVGFLSIGLKPSGSKDPFGIRRACLGIIRIIFEKKIRLSLKTVIEDSMKSYESQQFKLQYKNSLICVLVTDFIYERFKFYLLEKNIPQDRIESVLSVEKNYDLYNSFQKIVNLHKFLSTEEGIKLISILKRVRRILYLEEKKVGIIYNGQVKKSLFKSFEEEELYDACLKNSTLIENMIQAEQYEKALKYFHDIKIQLDNFFNNVLVNEKDLDIKTNRLNLLSLIRNSFAEYADFSLIDTGNEHK